MSKAPWLILGLGRDGFAPGECSDLIPGEPHQVTAGRRKKLPMNHRNPFSSVTLVARHSIGRFLECRGFLLIVLAIVWLTFAPKLQAVTPPPDGGYPNNNTAEGDDALLKLTTGNDNTAVGFGALRSNTTGALNTATGSGALQRNITGNNNTANGAFALDFNTRGNYNTATGAFALLGCPNEGCSMSSTGSDNTATGAFALFSNITGNENTATGLDALGTTRSFEQPHTEENYLTREMGFVLARKHASKLRAIALIAGFVVPGLFAGLALLVPGLRGISAWLACTFGLTGLFVERWLFFAQARHAVMGYYARS